MTKDDDSDDSTIPNILDKPVYFYFDLLTCNKVEIPPWTISTSTTPSLTTAPTNDDQKANDKDDKNDESTNKVAGRKNKATQGRNKRADRKATPSKDSNRRATFAKHKRLSEAEQKPRHVQHRFLIGTKGLFDGDYDTSAAMARKNIHAIFSKLDDWCLKTYPQGRDLLIYPWHSCETRDQEHIKAMDLHSFKFADWPLLHTTYLYEPSNPKYAVWIWARIYVGYDCSESEPFRDPKTAATMLHKYFFDKRNTDYKISASCLQSESKIKLGYFQNHPFDSDVDNDRYRREIEACIGLPCSVFPANLGYMSKTDGALVLDAADKLEKVTYDPIRAWHLEVNEKDARTASDRLTAMFPAGVIPGRRYPAGIRATFAPTLTAEEDSQETRLALLKWHKATVDRHQRTDILSFFEDLDGPLIPGFTMFNIRSIMMDITAHDPVHTGLLYLFEQVNVTALGRVRCVYHSSNQSRVRTVIPHLYALIKHFAPRLIAPFNLSPAATSSFYDTLESSFKSTYVASNDRVRYDEHRGVFTSPDDTALLAIRALMRNMAPKDSDDGDDNGSNSEWTHASGHDLSLLQLGTGVSEVRTRTRRTRSISSATSSVSRMTDHTSGGISTTSVATKLRLAAAEKKAALVDGLQLQLMETQATLATLVAKFASLEGGTPATEQSVDEAPPTSDTDGRRRLFGADDEPAPPAMDDSTRRPRSPKPLQQSKVQLLKRPPDDDEMSDDSESPTLMEDDYPADLPLLDGYDEDVDLFEDPVERMHQTMREQRAFEDEMAASEPSEMMAIDDMPTDGHGNPSSPEPTTTTTTTTVRIVGPPAPYPPMPPPGGWGSRLRSSSSQQQPTSASMAASQSTRGGPDLPAFSRAESKGLHGHELLEPVGDHVRLLFVNIGGLQVVPVCSGVRACGSCKDCLVRSIVNKNRIDVIGLSEVNVNWRHVSSHHCLDARTKGWFEACRISSSCYAEYPGNKEPRLYGGTSLWSVNKMATRVDSALTVRDPLGRWSGLGHQGRDGAVLMCLVAYRPVVNKGGAETVWSQQYAHFANMENMAIDPIARFDEDLAREVRRLQDLQFHIVLGIDANENLAHSTSSFRRLMEGVGLEETILHQHGPGPPTCIRGSSTIDGLFVSSGLRGLRCGYTGYLSDHTGLYIDIPMHRALNHAIPPVLKPAMRRLKLQDPRVVSSYLAHYQASIAAARIPEALQHLWRRATTLYDPESATSPLDDAEQAQFEWLDQQCTEAMLQAERQCRKLFLGAVPWSPAFQALQHQMLLYRTALRRLQGHKVSLYVLRRLARRVGMLDVLEWTSSKLRRAILSTGQDLALFKKKLAAQARRTHNEGLVDSIAQQVGQDATKVVRALMRREESRDNARIIRFALKASFSGAVAMVQTVAADGAVTTLTSKEDMETAITAECQARFRQASTTDFLTPPLFERVGTLGVTPFCDRILDGSVTEEDLSGVSEYAVKLLRQLPRAESLRHSYVDHIPDLPTFQYRWRRQSERTAAFPGRHFGHMMASMQDPALAEMHRQLEYIPMLTGCPPSSWHKAIDVLIEKKAGNFQVDKLRAICLFDCIANHSFKNLGKCMMSEAEAHGLLAKEQGGSRKGHRANYLGLEKQLSFDISRQLRRVMALCSNDARACYDRIVHSVASLYLQRVGVSKPAVVCIFSTIQKLEHYIRTVFGDSTTYFGGIESLELFAVPVSTIGQGNGAAPQIWALVSTPLLNMLRAEGLGMSYRCTLSGSTVSFVGYSFVDDTDLGICGSHLTDYALVASDMQRSLDHWEGGLRATGGAIAPEKTFWYLIDYKWHSDGSWSYKHERECPATLSVKDMHGNVQTIKRCPVNHAERTLGIYLSPDGCNDTQALVLRKKSVDWARSLRHSRLPRHLAAVAYSTTIDKALSYPLVATCLTPKQTAYIQSPSLTAALQLSGVGSDAPTVLRCAPLAVQGLGFRDLFVAQLYAHLEVIAFAAELPTRNTSQLLQVSMELLKLELGLNGFLFSHNYDRLSPVVTTSWVSFTWQSCHQHGISVHDSLPDFSCRRAGDLLLMEQFALSSLPSSTLSILNRCRMFLQVVSLSDITSGDGNYITECAWYGARDSTCNSVYDWPLQGELSERCWDTWRLALLQVFCSPQRRLHRSLGLWHADEPTTRFFYSPRTDEVFECLDDKWYKFAYSGTGRRRRVAVYSGRHEWAGPSLNLQRATVRRVTHCSVSLESYGESSLAQAVATEPLLESLRAMLFPRTHWVLDHTDLTEHNCQLIVSALRDGTCIAVSDGSFDPHRRTGAAAVTLQGSSAAGAITAQCVCPGPAQVQSAYRSELVGLYQAILLVHLLCRHYGVTSGSITIACDGLSALKQASSCDKPTPLGQKQFDLISACRRLMHDTPIVWLTHHVLGHQREKGLDGNQFIGPLDRWALLNDEMDAAAKAHRVLYADSPTTVSPQFLFGELPPVLIANDKICSGLDAALRLQINGKPLLDYWQTKDKFGSSTPNHVDWEATGKAMQLLSPSRRLHQSKLISKFVAVRRRLKLRHHSTEDTCPTCLTQTPPVTIEETVEHLYTCPSTQALWDERLDDLDTWLMTVGTASNLRVAIISSLAAWRTHSDPPTIDDISLHQLLHSQLQLGWLAAFEGRFSKGWSDLQEIHYRSRSSKPYHNGLRWLSQLIRKLFDISWDLWEHRNDALHRRNNGLRVQELQRQVDHEFLQPWGTNSSARLRRLFQPGLTRIRSRLPSQIEAWLYQVQTERLLLQQQTPAERVHLRQQDLMRRLFQPTTTTTTTTPGLTSM